MAKPKLGFIVGSTVVVAVAAVAAATSFMVRHRSVPSRVIPGPNTTLIGRLSPTEVDDLPYPPDLFPGARDVDSPYGTLRLYEWGPANGRKVLLVHGISTPCLALGALAGELVERGCRVMLLDLWGRGYSDGVADLPHDSRLYSTQILVAITSSPLSWTPGGFSLVGYSLGGGISVDFAGAFPNLVRSLVLLAPSGLIRRHHFGWYGRLLSSPWFPERWHRHLVGRQMRTVPGDDEASKTVKDEVKGVRDNDFENAPLSTTRPGVTVASAMQWQVSHHEGFINAFVSSIRYASISDSQPAWRRLRHCTDKLLVIAGTTDTTIRADELEVDARDAIGADKLEWRTIEGGHEFPMTRALDVAEELCRFWNIV